MYSVQLIPIEDPAYPPLLREIHNPPAQLYVRGNEKLLSHSKLIAVVGSRNLSEYSHQAMKTVLPHVVAQNVSIVSGLALGADTLAHTLSITGGQPTIAVLGTGVDTASIYPKSNTELAQRILDTGGTLVSEYPPHTPPHKAHFPARNRIIAGLCRTCIIAQAAVKSGSLITARLAMEANRDVLAIPGPITDPLHTGTNQLIRDGASPVIESNDILTHLEQYTEPAAAQVALNLTH